MCNENCNRYTVKGSQLYFSFLSDKRPDCLCIYIGPLGVLLVWSFSTYLCWLAMGFLVDGVHYKKRRVVWFNLVTSVSYFFCIIKYSGVPLPALHSKVIRVSRSLENIMGECFANEIVQWCGKGYEIEVTKMAFLQCNNNYFITLFYVTACVRFKPIATHRKNTALSAGTVS